MSTGQSSRHRSKSQMSKRSAGARPVPPPTLTPENTNREFEACAATASFFLYAQRSEILCLHHDTLAIERRFTKHQEDVVWIQVDTVSERGSGRLAVSYDAGQMAIVWDIQTGDELARFAAYEQIRTAAWTRSGHLAFGNAQGNVILFETATQEHISQRTIFDPITAIAPAADCKTFAIGYMNGSILIATMQPFTILHTLTTSKGPSRVTGLAWHGSNSKQKSDMLATQTAEGDLRVWSIPKAAHTEAPNIIRVLNRPDFHKHGPCWFAWSKNGRIVQHADGETRAWDVRTKIVTCKTVPTIDEVIGICNYGTTSTLFTLGRNHTVQQCDVNPDGLPLQVATVQHIPAKTPPSPPNSIEEKTRRGTTPATALPVTTTVLPAFIDVLESSEGEDQTLSPMQRIAREIDQPKNESRDQVGPLSPVSSRTSSVSSKSSGGVRKLPSYRYDKPPSSRGSNGSVNVETEFSYGKGSLPQARASMSMRSITSQTSSTHRSSHLRKELLPSPEDLQKRKRLDLFPNVKARLLDVAFRTPHYGKVARTTDVLRREMLSIVFGWNDDIESLIRDELSRHLLGSASGVLLSKWLGDLGADILASMIGSQSMSSSDWMLLALCSMGHDSQRQVAEAFVQRLLEKGDVHPAVAVLLGLGEQNDAVEVYVSREYYMEAVLLTCLVSPSDWQRQSYLVRKWGEKAVNQGEAQLAVRCFSCTSLETSEPWFSPRSQDAVFHAQREHTLGPSSSRPSPSPQDSSSANRMTAKSAALKLITTFGNMGIPVLPSSNKTVTPMNGREAGVTPIAQSALSAGPGRMAYRIRPSTRDPSSARTATPTSYIKRRLPSQSRNQGSKQLSGTPETVAQNTDKSLALTEERLEVRADDQSSHSRTSSSTGFPNRHLADRAMNDGTRLPSPAQDAFARLKTAARSRSRSCERNSHGLQVHVYQTMASGNAVAPTMSTTIAESGTSTSPGISRAGAPSPPLTGESLPSVKGKARDQYINSIEQAKITARQRRSESRARKTSKSSTREPSEPRGRADVRWIRPAKRSPSSPVPISPDEVLAATQTAARRGTERELIATSAVKRVASVPRSRSRSNMRAAGAAGTVGRATTRDQSPDASQFLARNCGISKQKKAGSVARSPSSPLPMSPEQARLRKEEDEIQSDGKRVRLGSLGRLPDDKKLAKLPTTPSPTRGRIKRLNGHGPEESPKVVATLSKTTSDSVADDRSEAGSLRRGQASLARKLLAAKELEDRRLSLARRPSAPEIPLPGQLAPTRPQMLPRYFTELGESPHSLMPLLSGHNITRSQTVDPDAMTRFTPKTTGTSTPSAPIGLPATPRAMRHPRYMSADPIERESEQSSESLDDMPQVTHTMFVQTILDDDQLAPLLPSTVFSQKGSQAPPRSASAPLERSKDCVPSYKGTLTRQGSQRTYNRQGSQTETQAMAPQRSPPMATASIEQPLHKSTVVTVEGINDPPMLPELQHLAGPPPPPPPPTMLLTPQNGIGNGNSLGVSNIVMDKENTPMIIDVLPTPDRAPAAGSPIVYRRGRGSFNEGIGSRIRNALERTRSTSRSSAKSPPTATEAYKAPYETVLPVTPLQRQGSVSRAKSPYEASVSSTQSDATSPPPPPPLFQAVTVAAHYETVIPPEPSSTPCAPRSRSASAFGSHRQPKEINANMPPEQLQQGAYPYALQSTVYQPSAMI